MSPDFHPMVAKQAMCKCCSSPASLYGVVDFHKHCYYQQPGVLDVSGIPIYYYRCPECGFLFTTAFDHFTHEDFQRHIYNNDYLVVDPDYRENRPRANAQLICNLFPTLKPRRILDYGSGEGLLAELLRGTGLFEVDAYDPFVPRHATRPPHRYDCIVSFEVLEHSTDPAQTMADMNSFLTNDGLILLSTLLQPANMDQQGLNWWYVGPRNGHVSLSSHASMRRLIQPFGFTHRWFDDNLHVLFRQVPPFAQHLIPT